MNSNPIFSPRVVSCTCEGYIWSIQRSRALSQRSSSAGERGTRRTGGRWGPRGTSLARGGEGAPAGILPYAALWRALSHLVVCQLDGELEAVPDPSYHIFLWIQ